MEDSDLTSGGSFLKLLLAAFIAVALLAALDVAADIQEGTTLAHVVFEGIILLVGLVGALLMARRLVLVLRAANSAREQAASLAEALQAKEAEATRWRNEASDLLKGLGAALDQQFERWGLSPAEKEVALLLLKGLTHKEIAGVRSVTEATARQQARAVYKKGGLTGRNDLSAFFLEDLLLPAQTGQRADAS